MSKPAGTPLFFFFFLTHPRQRYGVLEVRPKLKAGVPRRSSDTLNTTTAAAGAAAGCRVFGAGAELPASHVDKMLVLLTEGLDLLAEFPLHVLR